MRIKDALMEAAEIIRATGANTPLLDAEVLLSALLKVDRLYLIINKDRILSDEEYLNYQKYISMRKRGVPVQYIVGRQEFMGLDFMVEEGVLIPRPDTEILVEAILDWVGNKGMKEESVTIADIGTGSGAIGISLARYIKKSVVYAVDISPKALKIAQQNAKNNMVQKRMFFLLGDLLKPIQKLNNPQKLDVLVSNPPYIPASDIGELQIEVAAYEPSLALDGGNDGLNFYRNLIEEGWTVLKKGGLVAFEIGHNQAPAIRELFEKNGHYTNINFKSDLAGIQRVIWAETTK